MFIAKKEEMFITVALKKYPSFSQHHAQRRLFGNIAVVQPAAANP